MSLILDDIKTNLKNIHHSQSGRVREVHQHSQTIHFFDNCLQ